MRAHFIEEHDLYPYRFKPVYKDYLWGGTRILREFHRPEPAGVYAESWEIADHPDGMSVVLNGPLAGGTLGELVDRLGPSLMGPQHPYERFPLLIKAIDARDRLSVQVHPDNDAARRYGGDPKTEMWYMLDADPGARIFAGLAQGADRDCFLAALKKGEIEQVLNAVPVRRGDVVFIPGGRIHTIDAGCFILEVQQNSNTTYRVHDWGRVDRHGHPRLLHIEEALKVIRWTDSRPARVEPRALPAIGGNEHWELLACPFFRMERFVLSASLALSTERKRFNALFVSRGRARIEWGASADELAAGMSCLIPAGLGNYILNSQGSSCEVLRITVPDGP